MVGLNKPEYQVLIRLSQNDLLNFASTPIDKLHYQDIKYYQLNKSKEKEA